MRSGPCAAARSNARSCVLKIARLRQTESDASQSGVAAALRLGEPARVERGVDQRPRELPLVDVEGPDGDRAAFHALHELAIDVVLLVLGGHVGRPANEHEFRSVQTDPLRTGAQRARHIVGALDVGVQHDGLAVDGLQRTVLGVRDGRQPRGASRVLRLPARAPASDR